ncbi:hypothetical protein [Gordonia caeni]|uniref:Mce-associated membrane protein n=1 Tax=Gordonia caeni TaxID=1007097 RepID=A0ABP7NS41_9ACTN
MTSPDQEQKRLTAARERYRAAVREERLARIDAAPGLRKQARRRRAGVRLAVVAAVLVAAIVAGLAAWSLAARAADQRAIDDDEAARTGAAAAVTSMLSADPADPGAYLDRVLALSTGAQRDRLSAARAELRTAVAGFGAPSTGQVISAGTQPREGEAIPVLVVAQASAPELVGGAPGTDRVTVRVLMIPSGERWLVQDTERVS